MDKIETIKKLESRFLKLLQRGIFKDSEADEYKTRINNLKKFYAN